MNLKNRIASQNKLDIDLMIQNDKNFAGVSSKNLNKVLSFTPIHEDILNEYNKQFPKGYEYIDEHEQKKN